MIADTTTQAPELDISHWFNTPTTLNLDMLRGRVVFIHAFQMLCPACVSHGLPQTQRVQRLFRDTDLQVIGLHTVFEHHAAMGPEALKAFIHEYRLTFPIGIDAASPDAAIPRTMHRYGMRGTPTTVIIGRDGTVRHHRFGIEDDLLVGAWLANAIAEPLPTTRQELPACSTDGCAIPDESLRRLETGIR
ncbi:Thiol-disulfide oxidoreductase ResA [Ensifer sp. M14]|uniref:redoxin domain-containing protein n=1 Tax=Ensifer sp. M14 TaxID=2203782 RepID=UPI000E1CEAE1|nr:Thiol-disulfide oxidoreductase ResA [Ensifer sp. M14]